MYDRYVVYSNHHSIGDYIYLYLIVYNCNNLGTAEVFFVYNTNEMLIKVKVKTEAKKSVITKGSKDSYLISVKSKPLDGEANKEVIKLLREEFKVYNKFKIVSGHHSPSKIISVE